MVFCETSFWFAVRKNYSSFVCALHTAVSGLVVTAMCIRLILLSMISASIAAAASTPSFDDHRKPSKGDIVDVMPKDTATLRLLVFLPQIACQGCAQSVSPIRRQLQESMKTSVDVTVFISSDDDGFVRLQKEQHSWEFAVLPDPIRAYQKAFGVTRAPYAILTNRCGVVLAAGPFGSASFEWENVNVSDEEIEAGCPPRHDRIRLLSAVVLRGSAAIAGAGMQHQANIIGDSLVVVNATPLHKVMMFNMAGDSLRTFSHVAEESYTPFVPIMMSQPQSGRGCLFIDFTYEGDIPITTIVDYNGNVIERRQRHDYPPGTGRFFLSFSTDSTLETIVSGYRYLNAAARGSDRTGCVVWSRITGEIKHRFSRDSIHEQADLSNYEWTTTWIDDDEIAYISNLSRSLRVYGRKDQQRTRELQFDPDTSAYKTGWVAQAMKLNEQSTLEERQALQVHVSATSRVLKDSETGDYYIAFHNFTVSGYIDTFVSGPIGKPDIGTWFVGRNHHVHKVGNSVVYTTNIQDGHLVLSSFELSR